MKTLASSRGVSIMALAVEAAAPAINTRLQKKKRKKKEHSTK